MNEATVRQVERDLLRLLNDEYSFYQSLYILLDKQRDLIKYDKDDHLLDLFAEIERCRLRITESEKKISDIQKKFPQPFQSATVNPEVKKLLNCILTLVKKNISLVNENEAYVQERHDRIRKELDQLKQSDKILRYMHQEEGSPQFVDGTK